MNPKMIETWISEFIIESEKTKVPGTFIRLDKKSPLSRYNLDRETLVGYYRIDKEIVDRLYRCLFVYSIGFYENISDLMSNCPKRDELVSKIWVVYNILLEYNCRTEYDTMLTTLARQ